MRGAWGAIALGVLAAGCAAGPLRLTPAEYRHAFFVEADGRPAPILVDGRDGPDRGFVAQAKAIVASDEFKAARRVMLFVHGGLNNHADGIERIRRDLKRLRDDPEMADTYAIFVNWDARLETAVWQDVWLGDARGNVVMTGIERTMTPVRVALELGSVALSTPHALAEYMWRATHATFAAFPEPPPPFDGCVVWCDRYEPGGCSVAGEVLRTLLWPVRVLALVIARWLVVPSYEFLHRRIATLFQDWPAGVPHGRRGALTALMAELPCDRPLMLVGHSMGTIALNQLIGRHPDRCYETIVYMGSACTIREFLEAVPLYMATETGRETRFYSLHLHPVAEAREAMGWGLLPYGSLLEQLDAYVLAQPSHVDGTLGRWRNAAAAMPEMAGLAEGIRRRLRFRVFPVVGEEYPREHGDFDNFAYWRPEFYTGIPAPPRRPIPARVQPPEFRAAQTAQRLTKR